MAAMPWAMVVVIGLTCVVVERKNGKHNRLRRGTGGDVRTVAGRSLSSRKTKADTVVSTRAVANPAQSHERLRV